MKTRLLFLLKALSLLALSVVLTIYFAWLIYPLEVKWLRLIDRVIFSDQTIIANFNVLMRYLTQPWVGQLAMPDFPSSSDGLYHFEAVKGLFQIAQATLLVSFPILYLSWSKPWEWKQKRFYEQGFLSMAVLPLVLGLLIALIGFSNFFVLFHHILFPGDSTWIFDPSLDPVIKILPETYFLHCFLLFFILYELIFIGAYLKAKKHR